MLDKVAIYPLIKFCAIIMFHISVTNGFTTLQASTNYACIGENVTFLCSTSHSHLIWEVSLTDLTVASETYIFQASDRPGKSSYESTHGLHLHFRLTSNANGVLESTLLVYNTSTLLEKAAIECEGSVTQHLTFGLAYTPSTPTGIELSVKTYGSEFINVTLSWNEATGRVDKYIVNISIGLGSVQLLQLNVTTSSLNLDKIPYNTRITANISAINCVAESERAKFSFLLRGCNSTFDSVHGLLYNTSNNNTIVPSGEQILFGCEAGYYPREFTSSVCLEDGIWDPDPSEAVCHRECLVPTNLSNLEVTNINSNDSMTSLGISFHCKDGFTPYEEQMAVCSSNGTWLPDLENFKCHSIAETVTDTDWKEQDSKKKCNSRCVYIIVGSVLGSTLLLVFCGILFSGLACVVLYIKKYKEATHQIRLDIPTYEYISPVYESIYSPTVIRTMIENEAYSSCKGI